QSGDLFATELVVLTTKVAMNFRLAGRTGGQGLVQPQAAQHVFHPRPRAGAGETQWLLTQDAYAFVVEQPPEQRFALQIEQLGRAQGVEQGRSPGPAVAV